MFLESGIGKFLHLGFFQLVDFIINRCQALVVCCPKIHPPCLLGNAFEEFFVDFNSGEPIAKTPVSLHGNGCHGIAIGSQTNGIGFDAVGTRKPCGSCRVNKARIIHSICQ